MAFLGFLPSFSDITDNMFMEEDRNQRQEWTEGQRADQNRFNADQAERQRNWQADMSNTAYQRAMADMKAAGLNPMLASHLGGGSTPSGGQASGSFAGSPGSSSPRTGGSGDITSAGALKLMEAQADTERARAENIRADTLNKPKEGARLDQLVVESQESVRKMINEINLIRQSERSSAAQESEYRQRVRNMQAELQKVEPAIALMRAQLMESGQRAATGRAEEQKLWNEAKANLPQIERLMAELRLEFQKLETPGRINESTFQESVLGKLERLKKLLPWPFSH